MKAAKARATAMMITPSGVLRLEGLPKAMAGTYSDSTASEQVASSLHCIIGDLT